MAEGAPLLREYGVKPIEGSNPSLSANQTSGEMAERLKAHAWKACVPRGTEVVITGPPRKRLVAVMPHVGSNPTLSAI